MKYVDEFRDQQLADKLTQAIADAVEPDRHYRLMEFCGGHTHAIFRYGLPDLLPDNIEFIHGPGCPVCVLPSSRIKAVMDLAEREDIILCTYADLMRVPANVRRSLMDLKALGGDIRMVFSTQDTLAIARNNTHRKVVFFAIGFETTTPATAVAIQQAQQEGIDNFGVYCNHVLTPAALSALLAPEHGREVKIDGIFGPSHVSTIIGSNPYGHFAEQYHKPIVITGFEPLDLLQATLMLVRQINQSQARVENQYRRAVTPEGNPKAQQFIREVFTLRETFEWRGLGHIPNSALKINEPFAAWDAEQWFPELAASLQQQAPETKSCLCPQVLRGEKRPTECKLFGTVCTPDSPIGSCMVSSEGACAAYWRYGRFRTPQPSVMMD